MIARFSADRQHAQLISIPRDSWVDIPGHGMDKVNAAYAYGGPALFIPTLQHLTDVPSHHYTAPFLAGFPHGPNDAGGGDGVGAEATRTRPDNLPTSAH